MSAKRASSGSGAIRRLEAALSQLLERLMAFCFLAIFLVTITLVVLRYVFNSSITGANELITVLFVYTTSIGAAVAVGKREHIAIPAVVERLPRRLRGAVDALGLLLVAGLNAVFAWQSVTWISVTGSFLMPTTGAPRLAAQLSIPLGCGLASLWCVLRLLLALTGDEELGQLWTTLEEDESGRVAE
jgi:TRAP-type C4-dicarboxylate transport system permease small subunit